MATVPDKSGNTPTDRHTPDARDASSAYGSFSITPNNDKDLQAITRALLVGGAGDVSLIMDDGSALTITAVDDQRLPLRVRRVMSTGTTATGIVGLV